MPKTGGNFGLCWENNHGERVAHNTNVAPVRKASHIELLVEAVKHEESVKHKETPKGWKKSSRHCIDARAQFPCICVQPLEFVRTETLKDHL